MFRYRSCLTYFQGAKEDNDAIDSYIYLLCPDCQETYKLQWHLVEHIKKNHPDLTKEEIESAVDSAKSKAISTTLKQNKHFNDFFKNICPECFEGDNYEAPVFFINFNIC